MYTNNIWVFWQRVWLWECALTATFSFQMFNQIIQSELPFIPRFDANSVPFESYSYYANHRLGSARVTSQRTFLSAFTLRSPQWLIFQSLCEIIRWRMMEWFVRHDMLDILSSFNVLYTVNKSSDLIIILWLDGIALVLIFILAPQKITH